MRRFTTLIITAMILVVMMPGIANAVTTDIETVRLALTAPDNMDFFYFDQDLLVNVLIEIIENDPVDAPYHERVVSGALKVLGETHAPEAVDILIAYLDEYTTTCLYWLGTYASAESVAAILEYLDDEDPSVRSEAATALTTLPDGNHANDELTDQLSLAIDRIAEIMAGEQDVDVFDALVTALAHLDILVQLQSQ